MSARPEIMEAIRLATLAPSRYNTQPWIFVVAGDRVQIFPDPIRKLAVVDAEERELHVSLGSALENLVIAAHREGLAPEVDYFPPEHPAALVVRFPVGRVEEPPELFDAIPQRHTTRRRYRRREIPMTALQQLETAGRREGVAIHVITDRTVIDTVANLAATAVRVQWGNRAFREELINWIRFNHQEVEQWHDGLGARSLGLAPTPRWLGALRVRHLTAQSSRTRRVLRQVTSSSALVVFAAERNDRRHWVDVGRSFERVVLTATALGIRYAPMNTACEVPPTHRELQRSLHLDGADPVFLIRLGYAKAGARAPRRPLNDVVTARPAAAGAIGTN
jgi:nitroreductase